MQEGNGLIARIQRRTDAIQQSTMPSAIAVAVWKRFGDDRGGRLAALITFYGFLSVFPLLLLSVTFAALAFGESALKKDIVDSALAQFPVIGDQLAGNIHAIAAGNSLAVLAAVLGLLWGALGITNSLQFSSAEVWRRPREEDPSLWVRSAKGVELLAILASVAVLSTLVAGAAANGVARFGMGSTAAQVATFAGVLVLNLAGYLVALRLLAPGGTPWRAVAPGAVLGASGWTVLQVVGGLLVGHRLQHASRLYGLFAVVLGLIFWINLGAQLFLYASELNLVLLRREWPRSVAADLAP